MTDGPPWYWSLRNSRVEGPDGDANDHRLGPYDTRAEAEQALATARQRTEAWDDEDRRWKNA